MDPASSAPFVVVTGASSGTGVELARQFAANGFDLIVAAEDALIVAVAREPQSSGAQVEGAGRPRRRCGSTSSSSASRRPGVSSTSSRSMPGSEPAALS